MSARTYAAMALTSLALAACASPQPRGKGPTSSRAASLSGAYVAQPVSLLFASYDADGDLAVSRDELHAALPNEWARIDAGDDGDVSAFDFAAWSSKALGSADAVPGRISFDKNGDGSITEREFAIHLNLEFDRLDKDKDGTLVRAELVRQLQLPNRRSPGQGNADRERSRG